MARWFSLVRAGFVQWLPFVMMCGVIVGSNLYRYTGGFFVYRYTGGFFVY